MKEEIEAAYFDARHKSPLNIMYFDYWCNRMISLLPSQHGTQTLEIMAGSGEIASRLYKRVERIFCIDLSEYLMGMGKKVLSLDAALKVEMICADCKFLPFAESSFSCAFVQGGLHHARPELPAILQEVSRVLKPNGFLIGSEPANDNPIIRAFRKVWYKFHPAQGHDPNEDGFSKRELSRSLASAGLELTNYKQFGFIAYPLIGNTDLVPFFRHSSNSRLGKFLIQVDELLEKLPLIRSFGWASIFVAKKS